MSRLGQKFILSTMAVVAGVVGGIIFVLHDGAIQKDDYSLYLDGEKQETLSFSVEDMFPGDNVSYQVRVSFDKAGDKTVKIRFEGEGELAPYLEVSLLHGGEVVDSATLAEYIDGRKVQIPAYFAKDEAQEITLQYSLDAEVGDEAQGAEADFRVIFSSSGK